MNATYPLNEVIGKLAYPYEMSAGKETPFR